MKKANVVSKETLPVSATKGTVPVKAASSKAPAKAKPKPTCETAPTPVPAPAKSVPAEKKQASLPAKAKHPKVTTIVALINVGWGNQVFVRGQGGGLSWERGLPMTCNASGEWVWISTANDPTFEFKLLLNDIFWENGGNHAVPRGDTHEHEPIF